MRKKLILYSLLIIGYLLILCSLGCVPRSWSRIVIYTSELLVKKRERRKNKEIERRFNGRRIESVERHTAESHQ